MPRNPTIETRTESFTLRFTRKQMRAMRTSARRVGKTLSEWMRDAIIVHVQRSTVARLPPVPSKWPALPAVPAPVRAGLRKTP